MSTQSPKTKQVLAEEFCNSGVMLFEANKRKLGLSLMEKALSLDPDNDTIRCNYVSMLNQCGYNPKAIRFAESGNISDRMGAILVICYSELADFDSMMFYVKQLSFMQKDETTKPKYPREDFPIEIRYTG